MLKGFPGILQTDGYGAYKTLVAADRARGAIALAHCWAHARRRFFELAKGGAAPIADEALRRIAKLYAIEAEIRGQDADIRGRTPSAQPAAAQELKLWLEARLTTVAGRSPLAEAIRYTLARWDGLTRFLGDGRIELDFNPVERSIRPIAEILKRCAPLLQVSGNIGSCPCVGARCGPPLRTRAAMTASVVEILVPICQGAPGTTRLLCRQHTVLDQSPDDVAGDAELGGGLAHGEPFAVLLRRAECMHAVETLRTAVTPCAVQDLPWPVCTPMRFKVAAILASENRVAMRAITARATSGVRQPCSPVFGLRTRSCEC